MGHTGTSWEGTKWKARSLPRETLGRRLGIVGKRLSRPVALGLFLATFPVLALSVLLSDPTPASSGSCSAYTTINDSVRSRTEARCNNPTQNHLHRAWTTLIFDRRGSDSPRTIESNARSRSKARFSVETRPRYLGCGAYLGRGGVRFQDADESRIRNYCK